MRGLWLGSPEYFIGNPGLEPPQMHGIWTAANRVWTERETLGTFVFFSLEIDAKSSHFLRHEFALHMLRIAPECQS